MSLIAAELIARVSADTDAAERQLRDFAGRMGSKSGPLGGMFDVFGGNLLAGAVQGLGRGIMDLGRIGVGAFAEMVSLGADFESQMDQVTAVLGSTEAEAQILKDTVLDIAMNPNLVAGTEEVSALMYTLATAGMTAEEIVGGVAESVVLLANAAGSDFPQAAEVLSKSLSIFNLDAADTTDAVNGISGVLNASTFDLNDYGYYMANVGGTAAAVGLKLDDLNASAALLAPSFSTGRDAGTGFKSFLLGLNPVTAAAEEAMRELGMIHEDGTNIFYDNTGALVDLEDILSGVNTTMGDLNPQQAAAYSRAIWGTEGMEAGLAMLRTGGDEYERLNDIIGNTSAMEQAAERTDNLTAAWSTFNESIKTLKTDIGAKFEEPLKNLVQAITPIFDWATPQLTAIAEDIGAWLEAEIPLVEVAVKTAFKLSDGDFLSAGVAGLGELFGAAVNLDVDARIVDVRWGDFTYTYEAATGIRKVDWGDFSYEYNALAGITSVAWGDFSYNYDAKSEVTEIDWGIGMVETIDAAAEIRTVSWWDGLKTTTYDVEGNITAISWWHDKFTTVYGVDGLVDSMTWGDWTTEYTVSGLMVDVMWGMYTWTYDVFARITDVNWGDTWTTVYDTTSNALVKTWENLLGGPIRIPGRVYINDYAGGGAEGEPIVWETPGGNATGNAMFGGGLTWVGERGPELVRLPRTSRIYDDQESASMMGGVTVVNNNNVRNAHDIEMIVHRTMQNIARKGR